MGYSRELRPSETAWEYEVSHSGCLSADGGPLSISGQGARTGQADGATP